MWVKIAGIILRNRITMLIVVGIITIFMAFQARKVEMSYQYAPLLPSTDSTYIEFEQFKEVFGNEGNMIVIGVQNKDFFDYKHYENWKKLTDELREIKGILSVVSVFEVFNLKRNSLEKKFDLESLFSDIKNQKNLDSLKEDLYKLPVYENQIYNKGTETYLITIALDPVVLQSPKRVQLIKSVLETGNKYESKTDVKLRYSGLPFIRIETARMLEEELILFVFLALFVCAVIIYLFFRSFKVVLFLMLIISISVVWALGTLGLSGFKVTMLTGMIPPLIIVIGVPNAIYILNKFHQEVRTHGNKIKSLQRVINRIGNATFLTNFTTAIGFATFIFTNSRLLVEFGIITSINIMFIFLLSILLIPTIFSFISTPQEKYLKHLDSKILTRIIKRLVNISLNHRKPVFIAAFVMLIIGGFGISRIHTTGFMLDDVPHDNKLNKDLKFFEQNFNGLMPMEILIDTKRPNGIMQPAIMQKIEDIQNEIANFPELSKALSYIEIVKFARQAYFNGNPSFFGIPNRQELNFIMSFLQTGSTGEMANQLMYSFIDSTKQKARISLRMADIGTTKMEKLNNEINEMLDKHFPKDEYNTSVTGSSLIFFKGTSYLIRNLLVSLALAVSLIAIFMALIFKSKRMVITSLLPNFIPLVMTAAIMGFLGIPIKPSTVLVFSVAFGISTDDTIHYLAKFRQCLRETNLNISESVIIALKEIGVSMIYTSIILLSGFGIFCTSDFGGTAALGMLVGITLLIALFSNLILLPSLLIAMEKKK